MAVDVYGPPGGDPTRYLASQPDEALVALVLPGQRSRLRGDLRPPPPRPHRLLPSHARSREEAEDALQHTFAAAYRSLTSGATARHALKPWLYTIARNRCLTVIRARRTREDAATPRRRATARSSRASTDAVQRRADLRELVADLHRLPEDQRAAIVLFEMGDQSHAEIAEVLDVKSEKVKALVFQAREGLMRARTARDTPCAEIRQHLSSRTRALPRRGVIRRHLDCCPACAAYDLEVRRQRAALAIVLPVVPSLELKGSVLGPLLGGGATVAAGGAAVIGTGAAGTSSEPAPWAPAPVGRNAGASAGVAVARPASRRRPHGRRGDGRPGRAGRERRRGEGRDRGRRRGRRGGRRAGGPRAPGRRGTTGRPRRRRRHGARPSRRCPSHPAAPAARRRGATTTSSRIRSSTRRSSIRRRRARRPARRPPRLRRARPSRRRARDQTRPTRPSSSTGGTSAGGTTAGGSAPPADPAPSTDAGASGSAPSTPPDTSLPPADSAPIIAAEQLPPDPSVGAASDPSTAAPVTCPPGTAPVSTDPNATPAPRRPRRRRTPRPRRRSRP